MPEPLVLSRDTVRNWNALETRSVPRRVFGRIVVIPRGMVRTRVFWRIMAEIGVFRYAVALAPFPIVALLRPNLALPIAQAPLLMLVAIWAFESRLLGLSDAKRAALLDDDEKDRLRDALTARGRRALTRIAAGRPELSGTLHLVIEQSEIAKLPVLTLVSVQRQLAKSAEVLDLSGDERRTLLGTLFDEKFTDVNLHSLTLATKENLHEITLDTRSVSAHARLAAMGR